VVLQDGEVVVRDHSRYGTYVNGERIAGSASLSAGDRLRLGTPGIVLELVAAG
jgi:pSer/pThr/pTyr-binding forkhead associated (FHA) protein